MGSRLRARRALVVVLALSVLGLAAVPAVQAKKPVREPVTPVEMTFPAGLGCAFDVLGTPLPGSEGTSVTFADGTVRIRYSGRDRLTRIVTDVSVVLNTTGTLTFREVGTTLFTKAKGHTIFYFYPGDQGPFGTVGENGGLYYVEGPVEQELDLEQDLVTSFEWSGRVTDICELLS